MPQFAVLAAIVTTKKVCGDNDHKNRNKKIG